MKIVEVLEFLNSIGEKYEFIGESNTDISSYSPIKALINNSISWIRKMSMNHIELIDRFQNILIVCDDDSREIVTSLHSKGNFIFVSNPHKAFFKILEHFFSVDIYEKSVSETAIVNATTVGHMCSIGNFSYIGSDVVLGNNVVIEHNVTIQGKTFIGDNTIIESGTVIGLCGFGHYKEENGVSVRVPHLGGVRIGANCYIGSNCTIARGTLSDTIIGDYVKIDALCHIAHNVEIGNKVMITGGTIIAGSAIIEDDVWIGPNVTINNAISIGKHSFIGIGSVVTKEVPPDKAVFGVPARTLRDNFDNVYNS